ncbi:hypothetical protein ACIGCZ_35750 [Streptomyces nigra]|uniref:hypothetical protein n=1 Tax=Streptomyces nigra TaxID=1827580 RepID=UPI0037D68B79
MPEAKALTTELTSHYAAQVTNDLERNADEQERLRAEIASLQEQLAAVQHDRKVLLNMQEALGIENKPAQHAPEAESAADPSPHQQSAAARDARRKAAPTSRARPTLVELIRRHLLQLEVPRSAAEISAALGQAHPGRRFTTKVVRITLEGLVAKSQAERIKQGRSVFYTAPGTTGALKAVTPPLGTDH